MIYRNSSSELRLPDDPELCSSPQNLLFPVQGPPREGL